MTALTFTACPADSPGGGDTPTPTVKAGLYYGKAVGDITPNDMPIETDFAKAIAYANANGGNLTLLVGANVSSPAITLNKTGLNLWIEGLGGNKTISLTGKGTLFSVYGVTLTLGNNITLKGVSENTTSTAVVFSNSGTLKMKAGSSITGNNGECGVNISNGTFVMDGGSISGNTGKYGGVLISVGGAFTMNGGSISGNTGTDSGGVRIDGAGATFTMEGGEIKNNTATSTGGGGVYVYTGTFDMIAAAIKIYGNKANNVDNQVAKTTYGTIKGVGVGVNPNGW